MRALRRRGATTLALGLLTAAAAIPSTAAFTDTGTARADLGTVDAVPEPFTGVAAGDHFSLGWDDQGDLFAWGRNDVGQLGRGTVGAARPLPAPVAIPAGHRVVMAAAGVDHAVALTDDGGVWTWGNPEFGQNSATPRRLAALDAVPGTVVGVDAGGRFSLAWTRGGALYSWGAADDRLGRAATGDDHADPARVSAHGMIVDSLVVTQAAAGRFHGTAVLADGGVVGWGRDYGGAAGAMLTGLPAGQVVGTAAGTGDTLAWTAAGELFRAQSTPAAARVPGLTDVVGAAVSAPGQGDPGLWAWTSSGRLFAWGSNAGGKLGVGEAGGSFAAPSIVVLADGSRPRMIGAGADHTLYDAVDGNYAAAGANDFGQLGDGTTTGRTRFASVIPVLRWP